MFKKIALIAALLPASVGHAQNVTINIGGAPAAQAASLSGSWSFIARCPLATTTGTATFMVAAQGSYSGTFIDSLGQVGQLNGQINGASFTHSAKTPFLAATETGTISHDGRSYTATNSFGCQITGSRL